MGISGDILGIYWGYLGDTGGYLEDILVISGVYLGDICGISTVRIYLQRKFDMKEYLDKYFLLKIVQIYAYIQIFTHS